MVKEINEKKLIIICLSIFFVGILSLFVVSLIEPNSATIQNIDVSMVGNPVSVEGAVSDVYEVKGNLFFTLKQGTNMIKVVLFNNDVSINDGNEVRIIGEISMYKGELEIIANNLIILGS